ncbi:unnamed protein product [Pedinophyceae sp. YPF-701]|nr:unnamed protein product [Pedinophyceae sp. YPF-701]
MTEFLGRVFFSAIFILSGVMKLMTASADAPVLAYMGAKIENALSKAGLDLDLKPHYLYLLYAACLLEIAGGLLVVMRSSLGPKLLMLFLLSVTPIMHNFWDYQTEEEMQPEMINFMKNLSMFGALLVFSSMKRKVKRD